MAGTAPDAGARPRTTLRSLTGGAVLGLALAACALPVPAPPSEPAAEPPLVRAFPEISDRLLVEVNRARQRAGAGPLQAWEPLDRAAHDYAVELAGRGRLAHESPTPGRESMGQRLDAAGVRWRRAAENLGYRTGTARDVPPHMVAGWLASPAHALNLLEPAYSRSGIGIARDGRGAWYIVQLYVQPERGG